MKCIKGDDIIFSKRDRLIQIALNIFVGLTVLMTCVSAVFCIINIIHYIHTNLGEMSILKISGIIFVLGLSYAIGRKILE